MGVYLFYPNSGTNLGSSGTPPPAFGNCQNGLVGSAERMQNTPQKTFNVITKESLGEVGVHVGNFKNEKSLPNKIYS